MLEKFAILDFILLYSSLMALYGYNSLKKVLICGLGGGVEGIIVL
jgi:hypothetical protein